MHTRQCCNTVTWSAVEYIIMGCSTTSRWCDSFLILFYVLPQDVWRNLKDSGLGLYVSRIRIGQWFCGFSHQKVIGIFVYIIWIHSSNSCQITIDTTCQLTYTLGYAIHGKTMPGWSNGRRKYQWRCVAARFFHFILVTCIVSGSVQLYFVYETVKVQVPTCDHFGLNKMIDNN